jgi:hypothetical protein
MNQPEMLASDQIRELINPYSTTEWVTQPNQDQDGKWRTRKRLHTVHHKSLLDQLEDAITGASAKADEDAARTTYDSKPAAHLDALDVLARIIHQSLELATDLDIDLMPLPRRLSAISGRIGDRPNHRVKSWWVAARIATQWETRPFQPKGAPCPITECGTFGTLRVRYDEHLASCTSCGAVWVGEAEVQNLGRHVKWATDHELSKPRHWLVDTDGYPIECVECLPTRDAMTKHDTLRAQLDSHPGYAAC